MLNWTRTPPCCRYPISQTHVLPPAGPPTLGFHGDAPSRRLGVAAQTCLGKGRAGAGPDLARCGACRRCRIVAVRPRPVTRCHPWSGAPKGPPKERVGQAPPRKAGLAFRKSSVLRWRNCRARLRARLLYQSDGRCWFVHAPPVARPLPPSAPGRRQIFQHLAFSDEGVVVGLRRPPFRGCRPVAQLSSPPTAAGADHPQAGPGRIPGCRMPPPQSRKRAPPGQAARAPVAAAPGAADEPGGEAADGLVRREPDRVAERPCRRRVIRRTRCRVRPSPELPPRPSRR